MKVDTPMEVYHELMDQINSGSCVLFLGAGSTRNCRKLNGDRGLTGDELASETLKKLNRGTSPGFNVSLTEASEYFINCSAAARRGLDKFIQERLSGLQPTIGHYLATTFPWRAVITTNYNQVIEECWGAALSESFASAPILPIRTDEDMSLHAGNTTQIRLYKPHGCITIPEQKGHRMVISSLDYFESEKIRPLMYDEIRKLGEQCTTLFVGYSMADYTFRNIYYRLYNNLGQWAARSYSVSPVDPQQRFRFLQRSMDKSFNTTIVNDGFDTFMLRLVLYRNSLSDPAKTRILSLWNQLENDHSNATMADYLKGLTRTKIKKIPS